MANTLRFKRGLVSGIPTAALGEPLFTTDTFDLYIGNGTGNTRFQKYIASGTTSQLLRGDGSLLTMPIVLTSPSNGQVLKYDGTNWVNSSDAGVTGSGVSGQVTYWNGTGTITGSNNLFWDATNNRLGIGTNAPDNRLQVVTNGTKSTIAIGNQLSGTYPQLLLYGGLNKYNWSVGAQYNVNNAFEITPSTAIDGTTFSTPAITIFSNGNFGVNRTTDNGLRFQVTGDGYFSGNLGVGVSPATKFHVRGTNPIFLIDTAASTNYAEFQLYNTTNALQIGVEGSVGGTRMVGTIAYNGYIGTYGNYGITFHTNNTLKATLDASGNLGLGVVPSAWGTSAFGTNTRAFELSQLGSFIGAGAGALIIGNNYYGTNTQAIYARSSLPATQYQMNTSAGTHSWHIAPSGTAGAAITFTQAMTLDASGRLGIGTASPSTRLHIYGIGGSGPDGSNLTMIIEDPTGLANQNKWGFGTRIAPNMLAIQDLYANATRLAISSAGNVLIGTTTDAGYKLDVNGTMRVSGASTFGGKLLLSTTLNYGIEVYNNTSADSRLNLTNSTTGTGADKGTMVGAIGTTAYLYNYQNGSLILGTNGTDRLTIASTGAATFSSSVTAGDNMTISKNGDAITTLTISNTTAGTNSQAYTRLTSDASSGLGQFGKYSSTTTAYKILTASNTYLYNATAGDIAILNDFASGSIKFAAGGSSTAHFTIASTGAATFSSSVTANGGASGVGLYVSNNTNSRQIQLGYTSGAAYNYIQTYDGTNFHPLMLNNSIWIAANGNVGIANTSPSYKLDVTGEARVSNAIAIGTTPDTNKPFKILKNINGTVGINFENTSTGSLAFSAIQMGTDVTGGTKFTNLVYSSSGVTASGVYQPDGTSLINNGAGGLNFLGNPIRFYTGGSNGVLRLYFDNEGTTQLNATSPTTSITDGYRQYSADVVAGNAAPHFRTENGAIIKLYQETTAVGNSTISVGGGNAVLDDTEFDGYTLRQIVRALRNQGILQ